MKKLFVMLPFLMLTFIAFAQESKPMTIEVEGNSELSVQPDQAEIYVSLREMAMTVAEATSRLNKKTKMIEDNLKKTKLKGYDFYVDNYNVNINRIYRNGTSKDSGYVATQQVRVKVRNPKEDLSKITEALHTSADMGFSLQFSVSDALKKKVEQELLELALKDAQSKAQVIAKTYSLGELKVFSVRYGAKNEGYNFTLRGAAMNAMLMEQTDVYQQPVFNPESVKLSDKVQVVFAFMK